MHYLYGVKPAQGEKLVATFDSEQQLQAYVRWATLSVAPDGKHKFEQGSPLVGCQAYTASTTLQPGNDPAAVTHNPTPSML